MIRRAIQNSKIYLEISIKGREWTLEVSSDLVIMRTERIKFHLWKEFDQLTPDGRLVKTLVTFDDDKLNVTQRNTPDDPDAMCIHGMCRMNGEKELIYTRTIVGKGVSCVVTFNRI